MVSISINILMLELPTDNMLVIALMVSGANPGFC